MVSLYVHFQPDLSDGQEMCEVSYPHPNGVVILRTNHQLSVVNSIGSLAAIVLSSLDRINIELEASALIFHHPQIGDVKSNKKK